MTEVDDVAAAAIALCATRLDQSVSAEDFVELVDNLIHVVRESPSLKIEGRRVPLVDDEDAGDPPPRRDVPAHLHRPRNEGKRGKLTYDDRVAIRREAAAAKGDAQRYPQGFIPGLATRFGVSEQSIYNAINGKDGA